MYQSKGLAEIVRNPSKLTRKYLDIWFTGNGSFGKGLKMLGWPVNEDNSPLLVWSEIEGLRVNLSVEEKILYSRTILHYVKNKNDFVLSLNWKKLLSPKIIWGTLLAIWSQSKLLINLQKTYDLGKKYVTEIPINIPNEKLEVEKLLLEKVWPNLIAVDYMGEFAFSNLTNNLTDSQKVELINKLQSRISPKDWYTKSMLAWDKLQNNEISVDNFLEEYGYASNNDYELTRPRYYEILNKPKPKVKNIEIESMEIKNLEDLYVGFQYLRSEAKRKSLVWISALRNFVK